MKETGGNGCWTEKRCKTSSVFDKMNLLSCAVEIPMRASSSVSLYQWWGEGVERRGQSWCGNNSLSFFINIPDNAWPRLEPEHTLGEVTQCTEIQHLGQRVEVSLHLNVVMCACGWVFWVEGIALNIISGRFQKKSRLRMEIFCAIRVYFLRESQAHEPSSWGPPGDDGHATQTPTPEPYS